MDTYTLDYLRLRSLLHDTIQKYLELVKVNPNAADWAAVDAIMAQLEKERDEKHTPQG